MKITEKIKTNETTKSKKGIQAEHIKAQLKKLTADKMTFVETAEFIGVTRLTISNYKKAGLLPFWKDGNKYYFFKSEVIKSLQTVPHLIKKMKNNQFTTNRM